MPNAAPSISREDRSHDFYKTVESGRVERSIIK